MKCFKISKVVKAYSFFMVMILAIVFLVGCGETIEETTIAPTTTQNTNLGTHEYLAEVEYAEGAKTVSTTKVELFEGPEFLESSALADISVNGEEVFVYETRVNHARAFTFSTNDMTNNAVAIFDFEGMVTVTIDVHEQVTSAIVRPLAYGVPVTIDGTKITFTLDFPTSYVVEYNNDANKAIHLFTNTIETDAPDPNNIPDDMIYIGPGVYRADIIPVESNKTVYIAGGAVIYGKLMGGGVTNAKIKGRGIVSGSIFSRSTSSEFTLPFEVNNSSDISVEGITFLDPAGWTMTCYNIDGLTIDNVHIISARGNGDGISLQSCQDVVVKNCFVRSWDDSIVVKNYNNKITKNISVENNTIWTDLAQSMEVGFECYGATMDNIVFDNNTVVHNYHKSILSIHNADQAKITNVKFLNTTVEDASNGGDNAAVSTDNMFIDISILYNLEWTESGGLRGEIDGVLIENLNVLSGYDDLNTSIKGYDADHKVNNFTFKNVTFKGKDIKQASDLNVTTNDYTNNISYISEEKATGAIIKAPYILDLANNSVTFDKNESVSQEGYIVPDFAKQSATITYSGNKITAIASISVTNGTKTTDWGEGTESFASTTNPVSNAIDGNRETAFQALDWKTETATEYAAISTTFSSAQKIGMIRLFGNPNSSTFLQQNISVYGIKVGSTKYSRILATDTYDFSASLGNVVEIKIQAAEYTALQLRIYNTGSNPAAPNVAYVNEIEFYPSSLAFNKIVEGTTHEDVYKITNLVDGDPKTYYESQKSLGFPVIITIDLGAIYNVNYITLFLVPQLSWEARTQKIQVLISNDGSNFTEAIAANDYLFTMDEGNLVELDITSALNCRYVRFVVSSNSASGGEGAQLSEISIFE